MYSATNLHSIPVVHINCHSLCIVEIANNSTTQNL